MRLVMGATTPPAPASDPGWFAELADFLVGAAPAGAVVIGLAVYLTDRFRKKREQARLIQVWPVMISFKEAGEHPGYVVNNASNLAVRDLVVFWKSGDNDFPLSTWSERGHVHGRVPPNTLAELFNKSGEPITLSPGDLVRHDDTGGSSGGGSYLNRIRYRDAQGRQWEQSNFGQLSKVRSLLLRHPIRWWQTLPFENPALRERIIAWIPGMKN